MIFDFRDQMTAVNLLEDSFYVGYFYTVRNKDFIKIS